MPPANPADAEAAALPHTAPVFKRPEDLLITIIIPTLNEEGSVARLEQELTEMARPLPYQFEFLVIDNASTDTTPALIKEICARDSRWKYLRFSRNFTVEMSMTAGYHFATGDAMIVLYSDLQDPPNVIPRMIAKWLEGYDVVYGVRTVRPGDPAWRNFAVKLAYRLVAWASEFPIPKDAGDFRLISRDVRDALNRCGEVNRYMRGLIAWLGFRQVAIPYERRERKTGRSKAPFWPLVFFVFNAITSFSMKPLRFFTAFGVVMLMVSFVAACVYAYLRLTQTVPPGITTIIILLLIGLGINSLGIGILGEYVGRTYAEVKKRPLYIVQESVNIDPNKIPNDSSSC